MSDTGTLNPTRDLNAVTKKSHSSGDLHTIGEQIPAPSLILAGANVGALGSSGIPAREDHQHPTSNYFIVPDQAARDGLTGPRVEGDLVFVQDVNTIYIWNGSSWTHYTTPAHGGDISYTPSTSGLVLGSGGSTTGYYKVLPGRLVEVTIISQFGSSGSPTVSTGPTWALPYQAETNMPNQILGRSTLRDATGSLYGADILCLTQAVVEPRVPNASGALAQIGGSVPFPWAINDSILMHFFYKASSSGIA